MFWKVRTKTVGCHGYVVLFTRVTSSSQLKATVAIRHDAEPKQLKHTAHEANLSILQDQESGL